MQIKQGDIYWVDFEPSTGKEYKKKRPALVLQGKEISETSPYITVMPLTTKLQQWQEYDIFVSRDHKNNLFKDSVIKVQQIATFDRKRVLGKIGEANSPTLRKVRGYLRKHFKL
ncbi:type II toxin-antitoxin system PemK/MazF family toxin [Candidatus Peregrinibacteria bacterium]|jgi:mRNA interferase MazF|nr:type II toxin-antitoxin system PemK/MazF family toxin [Candidatus Peregrinibacteria bacterium]